MHRRLPAEWEEQDAVLLAWPHAATDWADTLDTVAPVFSRIALAISRQGNRHFTYAHEDIMVG